MFYRISKINKLVTKQHFINVKKFKPDLRTYVSNPPNKNIIKKSIKKKPIKKKVNENTIFNHWFKIYKQFKNKEIRKVSDNDIISYVFYLPFKILLLFCYIIVFYICCIGLAILLLTPMFIILDIIGYL